MLERTDARVKGCRTEGKQEKRDGGKAGCRKKGGGKERRMKGDFRNRGLQEKRKVGNVRHRKGEI